MTLEELPDLEKLFELNIYVNRLVECYEEDNDKIYIVAQLIQRTHRAYTNSMYFNLYRSHFSYIKSIAKYSKSYCCCKCDKMWKSARAVNRHGRTFEAALRHLFSSGAYKVQQTIFDLLADKGIESPEESVIYWVMSNPTDHHRLSSLDMGQLVDDIELIFHDQNTVFKLNLSFGFILFNNETEQMQ